MHDIKEETCSVRTRDEKNANMYQRGKKKVMIVQLGGSMADLYLSPFKCVPRLWDGLFALILPLTNGW